jgi:hypothetical protein
MNGLRDLVVDDRVIVEIKSVEQLARTHTKQLLTYLELTNAQVGLLINFRPSYASGGTASNCERFIALRGLAFPREPKQFASFTVIRPSPATSTR